MIPFDWCVAKQLLKSENKIPKRNMQMGYTQVNDNGVPCSE